MIAQGVRESEGRSQNSNNDEPRKDERGIGKGIPVNSIFHRSGLTLLSSGGAYDANQCGKRQRQHRPMVGSNAAMIKMNFCISFIAE
jgi:hypothetical protein